MHLHVEKLSVVEKRYNIVHEMFFNILYLLTMKRTRAVQT